jgi:hypothetical protein
MIWTPKKGYIASVLTVPKMPNINLFCIKSIQQLLILMDVGSMYMGIPSFFFNFQ